MTDEFATKFLETQSSITNTLVTMDEKFEKKFDELKVDVKELRSDVDELRIDVDQIKVDVVETRKILHNEI